MLSMKSLADLNGKWWYRLVKVLYGLAFIIVALLSAGIVYQETASHFAADWKITCEYGNYSTFNALHDKDISISNYDPDKAVPDAMDAQIKTACAITQTDVQAAQEKAATDDAAARSKCANDGTEWGNVFYCNTTYAATTYQIGPTRVLVHTPWAAAGYTLLDILIVLGIFEIGRRAFYYIALGKIRPSK